MEVDWILFWAAAAIGIGGDLAIHYYSDQTARWVIVWTWFLISALLAIVVPQIETVTGVALYAVACPTIGRFVGFQIVRRRLQLAARSIWHG